ncbi:J domain-containing protein [Allosphingosinicella sp.]|jgi:curved DNA-binding protein CbpA|uniref:J domain-containing protein n=1 Tax=Allosphingosinicella sp. TaxID=2823234 RepID=UPI002EDEDB97
MAKFILVLALIALAWMWWRRRTVRIAPPPMALTDARRLLGVREGASLADVRAAHRRLIAKVHPDTGGSPELANQVNIARDTLVAEMNRKPPDAS